MPRRRKVTAELSPSDVEALREQATHEDWLAEGAPDELDMVREIRRLRGERDDRDAGVPASASERGEWATVAEVAKRHRLSAKTVRRDIASGRLRAHDGPPKPYRIKREDEDVWAEARRTPGARSRTPKPSRTRKPASTFRDLAKGTR